MIANGSFITFKSEYNDPDEVFVVSQWDGHRGWAGDDYGFGWYFTANQVNEIIDDEDNEEQ